MCGDKLPGIVRWLAILFVVTGASALLVEQTFERLLSTLLGASTPAAATVLAVYFFGLALGGALYQRCARRRSIDGLRAYAMLEGAVGLWVLFLAFGFDRLISVFTPWLALAGENFAGLQCLRMAIAACWILPATLPMGASFPAMADALEQCAVPERERSLARFYSLNLLGAIVGAVAGPWVVFPCAGLDGTLLGVGVANGCVALTALSVARRRGDACVARTGGAGAPGLILAMAFLSGLVFFALEVVWTHLIGAALGNSVYAFAAMLTAVLLGLALGGAEAARRWNDRSRVPATELAGILLWGALVLAVMNGLWPYVPHAVAVLCGGLKCFWATESLRWGVAVLLLALPAKILGMVYPALFRLEIFPSQQAGRAAGQMVAVNAVGCIGGALLAGFGLIPWLGSERTLQVLTAVCVIGGLALSRRWQSLAWAGAVTTLLVFGPRWNKRELTSGKQVYLGYGDVFPDSELRFFHEDTHGGITTVVRNPGSHRHQAGPYQVLLTNGKFQGDDSGELDAQTGFALVPILFVPEFDDALVIGLGTGVSAHVVDSVEFARVDIAEIAPGIVQAARQHFAHVNRGVLDSPRVRVFLEDGRNLLLRRVATYDLITMEISSVWFAGATNLYSEEFYRLARSRLRATGVLQQWIQLHHIGLGELETVIATVQRVFPEVSFWVVGGQGIIVASNQPQVVQTSALARLEQHATAIAGSGTDVTAKVRDLLSSRLLAPSDVRQLCDTERPIINTDRNRRLEYFTPRYNTSPVDHRQLNIAALQRFARP